MEILSTGRRFRVVPIIVGGLLLFAYLLMQGCPTVVAGPEAASGRDHWRGEGGLSIQLDQKELLQPPVVISSGEVGAGGWITLLSEDFEGTFPKTEWITEGDPTWGKRGYRKYAGAFSGYAVGGGQNGVKPPGPYPNDVESWLVAGPFDLTQGTDAQILYHAWIDTEYRSDTEYDVFWVGASIDGEYFWGENWAGNWAGPNGCNGWCNEMFDLTDVYHLGNLCGQPKVWVAFTFESDSHSSNDEGVYLDDITIRVQAPIVATNPLYLPWVMSH